MFWIITISFLAGMLVGSAAIGVLLAFLHGFSLREEAASEFDPPHFGPFP